MTWYDLLRDGGLVLGGILAGLAGVKVRQTLAARKAPPSKSEFDAIEERTKIP